MIKGCQTKHFQWYNIQKLYLEILYNEKQFLKQMKLVFEIDKIIQIHGCKTQQINLYITILQNNHFQIKL